jgi:hypothetical protein
LRRNARRSASPIAPYGLATLYVMRLDVQENPLERELDA